MLRRHRNSSLFSNHYLDGILPGENEWKIDIEPVFKEIKTLYDSNKSELPALNESQLRKHFLDKVFEILGFTVDVEPPTIGEEWTKKPDYALFINDYALKLARKKLKADGYFNAALCIAEAKKWGRPFDRQLKTESDPFEIQNPSLQMSKYLWLTGVKWGILTDGKFWRLYERETSKRLDIYYEIDLEDLLLYGSLEDFKYFYLFFSTDAFPAFLDKVYKGSVDYAKEVGDELKENVYKALNVLSEGFLKTHGSRLSQENLKEIHDNSLILLYRLLFILYAEYRGLLPLNENTLYTDSYSLDSLKKETARKFDSNETIPVSTFHYWNKLKELFEIINNGNKELAVPPYNGGLFNPEKHPFLEKHRIGDFYIARAIDLLSRSNDGAYIDYGSLEIRHLGSIYEGLLEYKLKMAEEDLYPVKEKDKEIYIPLSKASTNVKKVREDEIIKAGGICLITDKGERKATGSYYTPDYIVEYIVENTIRPIIEEKKKNIAQNIFQLKEKIKVSRGINRETYQKQLLKIESSLIDEILSIKVLDPAMGSGHFLVEATDFLAHELIKVMSGDSELIEVSGVKENVADYGQKEIDEEDIRWARREVVEKCIFGVDLNPLAVELAKLSLWLHTVAKNRPLNFLDHHLRCGNSLIGARIEDLAGLPELRKKKVAEGQLRQLGLFESIFKEKVNILLGAFAQIEGLPSDTVEQIRQKEKLYQDFRRIVSRFQDVADIWTSVYFGNGIDFGKYQSLQDTLRANDAIWENLTKESWFKKARAIATEKRFFHWELEFPEIFFEGHRRKENPGFDCVIGNPPYIDSEEMTRSLPDERAYCSNCGRYKSASGNWDIFCVFIELGIILNKHIGYFGMIIPNKLLAADYAYGIQNVIEENRFLKLRDYSRVKVFGEEANVYPIVIVVEKIRSTPEDSIHIEIMKETIENPEIAFTNVTDISTLKKLPPGVWSPLVRQEFPILHEIITCSLPLSDVSYVKGGATVSEAYAIKNYIEDQCLFKNGYAALINTGTIDRYEALWGIHGTTYIKNVYLCPTIRYSDLEILSETRLRETMSEKLIIVGMGLEIETLYDKGKYLAGKSTVLVLSRENSYNLKFLCSCLNSKLISFVYRELFGSLALQGGYLRIGPPQIERIPVPHISFATPEKERKKFVEESLELYEDLRYEGIIKWTSSKIALKRTDAIHDLLAFLAEQMIELNKAKNEEIKGFLKWLEREIGCEIDDLTGKTAIKDYHEGDIEALLAVLKKNKQKLSIDPSNRKFQERLERHFSESISVLQPLKTKIKATDNLIDQIVYKLYGLTEEEIEIVEGKK